MQKRKKNNPNLEIAIANIVLNAILARGWVDYDNFSSKLSNRIANNCPKSKKDLLTIVNSLQTPFFKLNKLKKSDFIGILPINEIFSLFGEYVQLSPLTFSDIFVETNKVSVDEGKSLATILKDTAESVIQNALVDSLREKNATNCRSRGKDTVLEVADLEHFILNIQGNYTSFSVVAKGFKSVGGKTITLENIAHQIMKAYNRTDPDYVLLVLAKELADSVISELVQYGKSIGNEYLVIIADPVTVARFLKARNLL